jgi:DNA-binding NarL/FixJ family response regulator
MWASRSARSQFATLVVRRVGSQRISSYDQCVQEDAYTHQQPSCARLLSARELEVLHLTSLGLTNAEVASRLSVSVHAVKFHLAAIYRRLGVANRTEAAFLYLRAGIGVDIPPAVEPGDAA